MPAPANNRQFALRSSALACLVVGMASLAAAPVPAIEAAIQANRCGKSTPAKTCQPALERANRLDDEALVLFGGGWAFAIAGAGLAGAANRRHRAGETTLGG